MCGFGGRPIQASRFMPHELIEKIISNRDFLSSLEEIRLNGRGESSLHPDFTQILQRIAGCFSGVRLSLFTNLMFEDETILDNLLKYNVELLISVDSPNKANYEYIRRGANFELLINRLEKLSGAFLVFTLQTSNIDEIRDIGKLANQYHLGLILNIVRTDNEDYRKNFQNLIDVNGMRFLIN
jgi:MoaA/NifB/PqqE/SkfB family radical SAM enzyme